MKKVTLGVNDLLSINPNLASEWHPTKNGDLKPYNVSYGSDKKVWWMCKFGHEWEAKVSARKFTNCPYCSGQRVLSGFNDLETKNPDAAKEWHPTKNGDLKPSEVTYGSGKIVWWLCKNGHEYQKSVKERCKGRGCVYCAGQKAIVGINDLATKNPDIANEWHPTKNGDLKPSDVMPQTNKKVWWMCKFGHEWEAKVEKRTRGEGCPECQKFNRTSFPEYIIFYYIKKRFPDAINSFKSDFLGTMELDIYIPSIKTGIEYDGVWHILSRDIYKDLVCSNNNIRLIRVRLSKIDAYERKDPVIIAEDNSLSSLQYAISELFKYIANEEFKSDISKDYKTLFSAYRSNKIQNSLTNVYPTLAKEWHPTKNGDLSPDNVPATTAKTKYWWKCSKCGYEWEAQLANRINRINSKNCPCCSGKKVVIGKNDLDTTFPLIAKEWHPTKNGNLKSCDVTKGCNKKVWWKCSKCGYEWIVAPNKRTSGSGCPACSSGGSKKAVMPGVNDFETKNPTLALEWDISRNGNLRPSDVLPHSSKKVWWKCSKCGYEWENKIKYRSNGSGCPNCHSKNK